MARPARAEFAPCCDLKAQFDAVMDSVENNLDRVSFSEAFPMSEKEWNSGTAVKRGGGEEAGSHV